MIIEKLDATHLLINGVELQFVDDSAGKQFKRAMKYNVTLDPDPDAVEFRRLRMFMVSTYYTRNGKDVIYACNEGLLKWFGCIPEAIYVKEIK